MKIGRRRRVDGRKSKEEDESAVTHQAQGRV